MRIAQASAAGGAARERTDMLLQQVYRKRVALMDCAALQMHQADGVTELPLPMLGHDAFVKQRS
jgi:hypothetical protein